MPKSISQLNKELSKAREDAGYVEVRLFVHKDTTVDFGRGSINCIDWLKFFYPKPTVRNGMLKAVDNGTLVK